MSLVDEIHTCDSSRYWKYATYEECFKQGLEPERFDKDVIRLYVKDNCNPYDNSVEIPEIPVELVDQTSLGFLILTFFFYINNYFNLVYKSFYNQLCGSSIRDFASFSIDNEMALSTIKQKYFNVYHPEIVILLTVPDTASIGFFCILKLSY